MATLTVDNSIYERLVKKAEERKITVDALVTPVLQQLVEVPVTASERQRAFDSFVEMARKHAAKLPPGHVVDDSRESIYGDDRGL
jgi:hypothetical protein